MNGFTFHYRGGGMAVVVRMMLQSPHMYARHHSLARVWAVRLLFNFSKNQFLLIRLLHNYFPILWSQGRKAGHFR